MNNERISISSVGIDPFLLVGTGFNLEGQMQMIREESIETPEVTEWKEKITEKNVEDLKALYKEYLAHEPVLPFELDIKNGRVVCPKYGGQLLVDTTSKTEREGSIYASVQNLEEKLLNAVDGDTFVLISPPGWSGYVNKNDKNVLYPDMQAYYYRKLGSEIQSMTFVAHASLLESEKLHEYLTGKPRTELTDEKTRILSLTSSLLSFKNLEPYDLVHSLEQVTGQDQKRMYELLENSPAIKESVTERIQNFADFIKENIHDKSDVSLEKIKYELGKTVLDMKSLMTRGRVPQSASEYSQTHRDFERDGGCNGGGGFIETPFGLRRVEEEEEFPNYGLCAMSDACISELKGHEQSLGLCMICKTCDRAFRSGKTYEEIKAIAKQKTKNTEPMQKTNIENKDEFNLGFVALIFVAAIGALKKS